jgi:diguanylate cyclase (GGDEF)-like protein
VLGVVHDRDLLLVDQQTQLLREREALLREQSVHDALTGLFNRRYLEETLGRELARAERQGGPVGLIMLDIDHLKRVNDTRGHGAGAALLAALGPLLDGATRAADIPCRYGGEEFTIVLPGASLEVTVRRAEEIRAAVAGLTVVHAGSPLDAATVSAGVAAFPEHAATGVELLAAADAALYRSKAEGRNRVTVAS